MFVDFSSGKEQSHAGYFLQEKKKKVRMVTQIFHPQFATSYFLFWMPCYRCKQRITVFGLQTYSNILTEGILLKMLRSKRELDLEQAI